jgi:Xaa-Pro aminopeptidase
MASTQSLYTLNLRRFAENLAKKRIDAALISSWSRLDINLPYLTGCRIEHSFLIVPNSGRSVLIVSEMELERAEKECMAGKGDLAILKLGKDLPAQISALLKKSRVKRLGMNLSLTSAAEYRLFRKKLKKPIVDIGRMLLEQRMIKSDEEIRIIKEGCKLTDEIMQKTIQSIRSGLLKTEHAIAGFLGAEARKHGCEPSFETIVASGRNASMPHYRLGNLAKGQSSAKTKLQKGFCVIDYGINYKGYCTDITRTVYVGKPSQKEIDAYNKVLNVQQQAISMAKEGVKCSSLHNFAAKKLGKKFMHGLGHGIGFQIHELPGVSSLSKQKFAEGMVFTIEPGYYEKGKFGIRIEDDVLIKDGKAVVLTRAPKGLIPI